MYPTGEESLPVDLVEVIDKCNAAGLRMPMILRFPQVIEAQLARMHHAFKSAVEEYKYAGKHRGVFPFKVNQRREFIQNITNFGRQFDYGLEVGSKTEFIAALSYPMTAESLMICNGFKDREFIEMGFIAKAMGRKIILVVEGPDELQTIIDIAKTKPVCPEIGFRVKLYSKGSGKWEKSSGESSKFGLTSIELVYCMSMLEQAGLKDKLSMLHFHIGSQITEIKRIKNAVKEASIVYAKTVKMDFLPKYLNIGGGVGVDYDGSKTSFQSSANYSSKNLQMMPFTLLARFARTRMYRLPIL